MDIEGKEEEPDTAAVDNLGEGSPKIENAGDRALDLLKAIHTPQIGCRNLNISGDLDYKQLYEDKVKELADANEFLMVEEVTKLQESLEQLKAENAEMKSKIVELSEKSTEVDSLRECVKEKDKSLARALRNVETMQSRMSGTEMEFEQYKMKKERREQELLERLTENGVDLIEDLKKSIASLHDQNKKLEIRLDEQKQAREEEMRNNEKIINVLKEENSHNEKVKHEIELALQEKNRELEQSNKYMEKVPDLEKEMSSLRETILVLQNTITTLETEKQELSVRISETPSIVGDTEVTLTMDDTCMSGNNLSLMEMDETLVCELIGKNLPDAFQPQIKSMASTVETLRAEKKSLIDENEKLSAQIYENVQETDNLKFKYERMLVEENNRVLGLRETLKQMKNDHHILQEQLKDTEASVKVLQSAKDKLNDELYSKKEEWNLQKNELERKIEFNVEKATRCEEKIMELNSAISALINKNETLEEQLEIAQTQANSSIDLNTDFRALVEKYAALMKENAQNKSKLSDLETKMEKNKIDMEALINDLETQREKTAYDYSVIQEKDIKIHEQIQLIANLEERWRNSKPDMDRGFLAEIEKSHKQKLSKLEEENKAQKTEIDTLKRAIECVNRESKERMQTFIRKNREWQETTKENSAKLDELNVQNEKLKVILSESRQNVKILWELRQQISEHNAKFTAVSIERGQLRQCLEASERRSEQLQREKESLYAEIEAAKRNAHSDLSIKLDERDAEIVKLRKDLEERDSQLKSVQGCVLTLQREEQETMKAIEEMRDKHLYEVGELERKISVEEEQKRRLQVEKDSLDCVNKDLKEVITELRSLLQGLNIQLAQKDETICSVKKSQEDLEKELDNIREKHRQEMENMKADSTQIDCLKTIITNKTQAFDQLSFSHKNLQKKFDELDQRSETNISELDLLRQRISELQGQVDEKISENKCLTEKMRDFSTSKEELQKMLLQNQNLKVELNLAAKAFEGKQDEIIRLTSQIKEQNMRIDDLQRELALVADDTKKSVCSDEIKALEKENQEFIQQFKTMKSDYEKKLKNFRDANANLVQERDHLKTKLNVIAEKNYEIELLKDRVRKKDKNIDKLNTVIKEKMTEINELKLKKGGDQRMGRDSSPTSRGAVQKERRRSDRQSIHDINRSIYFELEHEVGTMTDPTSELCQCKVLAEKITNLQTELTFFKCQLSTAKKDLEDHPLKNDVYMLQLEVQNKDQRINNTLKEITRLKEELCQAQLKYSSAGICRINPSTHQASCQTDEPRALKTDGAQLFDDGARDEKENEVQNGANTVDYKREFETISSKYNNLKRAYFKIRAKYEGD